MKMTVTVIAKSENYIIVSADHLAFSFRKEYFNEEMELNKSYEIDMPESNYEYALLSQYPFVDVDVSMVKNDHV
jgi:hypothetical protein